MRKLWVVLCLLAISSGALAQEQSPKVAVIPFAIRGTEKLPKMSETIEALLIKQLAGEGIKTVDPQEVSKVARSGGAVQTDEQARAAGQKLQARYVLVGSFNQIGNSISLDARLVDVTGQKKTEPLFSEEKGVENLAAATNGIVQQTAVHVLSKAVIADIVIRGNERIEADAIKAGIKSKKGELLKPDVVSEDIKSIYKMGYFEKVDAEVADSPAGKVLTFVVQENPTVQEISLKGNKKISDKDILAALSSKAFSVLQRNVVAEDVQKIIKLYHQKAFFNVEVKSSIDFPKDPRKATITFNIKENSKIFIKKISFQGNKHYSDRKLRGVMQTKVKNFLLSLFTDRGILQNDILNADVDRISVFYHDQGFMDAKVGTPEITSKDDGFYISIVVEEGERYKVSDVKLTGDTLDDMDKISKKLDSKPSDYFSREKLRHDIDYLTKTYMNEGFAYTEVSPQVKRNPENETADITYTVGKGDLVHIGKIYISGNTKTRDRVIRRELKLYEGDVFNGSKLEKSILNLKKLDYFEDVEIIPTKTAQAGIMDLHIKVKEKMTGSISVGGGYSSDDGLFTTASIMQRNFLGKGQTLGVKGYLGQDASRYVASFTEPWMFDHPWALGIDVFNWLRDYNSFTKESVGFSVRTGHPVGDYSRFSVGYTLEEANVTDVIDGADPVIKDQEGRTLKSSVVMGFERDTTDHPFLPTRGTVNAISAEVASKYLGSETDFLKTQLRTGAYFPLYWKLIGHVRGEYGYIAPLEDVGNVKLYERFFLGGINSLRGFNFADVGPTDGQGNVIGGFQYGLATFELLFPILEKMGIRGVLFFDAGNAYDHNEDFDLSQFRTDAGAGLRWNSPLGPLRIEWGYNLDPKPGEDSYQWQFSAGAYF